MKAIIKDREGQLWCGPTAVAAITGKPLTTAIDALRDARYGKSWRTNGKPRPPIMGTMNWQVEIALRALGWEPVYLMAYDRGPFPTLAKMLRERKPEHRNAVLLINVTRHWVVVKGRTFIDNHTGGKPVTIGKAPGRRKRVRGVWVVSEKGVA